MFIRDVLSEVLLTYAVFFPITTLILTFCSVHLGEFITRRGWVNFVPFYSLSFHLKVRGFKQNNTEFVLN